MHNYLYVEARLLCPGAENEILSFASARLSARSDDDAYDKGYARMVQRHAARPTDHSAGRLMNDYVVRLSPPRGV